MGILGPFVDVVPPAPARARGRHCNGPDRHPGPGAPERPVVPPRPGQGRGPPLPPAPGPLLPRPGVPGGHGRGPGGRGRAHPPEPARPLGRGRIGPAAPDGGLRPLRPGGRPGGGGDRPHPDPGRAHRPLRTADAPDPRRAGPGRDALWGAVARPLRAGHLHRGALRLPLRRHRRAADRGSGGRAQRLGEHGLVPVGRGRGGHHLLVLPGGLRGPPALLHQRGQQLGPHRHHGRRHQRAVPGGVGRGDRVRPDQPPAGQRHDRGLR